MAAGITASLSAAGVLNVIGTDDADQSTFANLRARSRSMGSAGSWTAAQVKSIVVDLKGGNDVVSFQSNANGGNQTIAEAITVKSGAGSERVHLANGVDISFANAGQHA